MSFYILSPLPTTAGGTGTVVAPTAGQVPIGNANGTYTPGSISGGGISGVLPVANGGTALSTPPTNGQLLIGNGTGYTLSTLTAGTNITITNTAGGISIASTGGGGTPGGLTTQIQYNNAGAFAGLANLVTDGTNVQINNQAGLRFSNATTNYVAFRAPASIGSNVNWTLPATDGTAGQVLSTDGSGNLSWVTVTITPTSPTNNTLPVVSGTPTVGQTLSSTSGTWNGYPAPTFAYQWVRGAATNIPGATSSSYQLVDADYNTTVKCTVTATNSAGSASATSAATATIAAGVPGAPTSVTASPGNAQATVTFTAPAITGGVAITSYTVTSSPGALVATGSASPITVTGLTNGTAYTFTVTATNSIGTSASSAASNSVTPLASPTIEYLIVAGGGGGGNNAAGGGGAGGLLTGSTTLVSGSTITVGSFGAGGSLSGSQGSPSSLDAISTTGGGAGGGPAESGGNGGSGGGAGYGTLSGGTETSGQGFAGGSTTNTGPPYYSGAGGGGAGAAGQSINATFDGGAGGTGLQSSITGTATYYAGGGAGANKENTGSTVPGGLGGGGNSPTFSAPGAGGTNLGGGGGARCNSAPGSTGANGGSGVVIIAYPNTYPVLSSIDPGLTYDTPTRTGYRVYRFTAGTGTITL